MKIHWYGDKIKTCFLPHMGAMLVDTVTRTKVLGGITVLAANLTVGLVISSAVCIDGSCSSLNCKVPFWSP